MSLRDRGTTGGPLEPVNLADVDDGVQVPVIIAPGTLFINSDFWFEIARGNVIGMKVYTVPGRSDGVSMTDLEDVSQVPATTILPNPGGIQLEVVSSSPNDTAAGSGVQSVDIHYLDTTGLEQEETVTMNGVTPVNTVATDIDIVQWIHTCTIGTAGGVSDGNISLRDTTGVTAFEYIAAGGNQSLSARYTIPTAKTGFILGWEASGITKRIDFRLRATVDRFDRSLTPDVFLFQDAVVLQDSTSGWRPFKTPLKIPASGMVKVSAISAAAGGDAGTSFDILIIDDGVL